MPHENPQFKIGSLAVQGDLILSPMDGFSDSPFRSLTRRLGSAVSYTEFVRDKDILERPEHVEKKLVYRENQRPVVYQIYGFDAERLLEAALWIREREPDVIDVNMGCPNASIAQRGAGVGMMRRPLVVARTFKKLTRHLDVPITAKIRLGWNDCRNYLLISRIVEENGGALIAIHGRTKEDRHSGLAELDAIAEVKQALSIPVIGNGGVQTSTDIETMIEHTGCDGVMIGRAARGNPWIFSRRDRHQISTPEVKEVMFQHLDASLAFYGNPQGLILFRKFAAEYLKPYKLTDDVRQDLLTLEDPQLFKENLTLILRDLQTD